MYEEDWSKYRKYRILFFAVWLGSAPVAFLCGFVSQKLFHSDVLLQLASIACFVLFLYTCISFMKFPCPRCRQCFAGRRWYNQSFFARRCQHCGFTRFSTDEE